MLPHKRLHVVCFTTLGWILLVICLAEKKSMYTRQGGGCGIFECEAHPPDMITRPDDDVCSERRHHARTIQAFATMGAIFMSFEMILHFLAFVKPNMFPISLTGHLANVHLISAVMLLVAWCTMIGLYASELCGFALRGLQSGAVGYGVFFMVSISCMELTSMFICRAMVKDAYPVSSVL
eukprot:TRINITY_DN23430_c0_g1_i1.p2 TRINITY_DN23430_c0_g1~~TRINITY_DN23430_c0_g1_i1.p2  ORF type:complete len:180 (+),score=60.64 TRINITY_DN23430_c0_g1_i1:64-603(+)